MVKRFFKTTRSVTKPLTSAWGYGVQRTRQLPSHGMFQRTLGRFTHSNFFKKFMAGGAHRMGPLGGVVAGAAMWGAAAFVGTTASMLAQTVRVRPLEKVSSLNRGPGYIAWSKANGMPGNHLSTEGLSLSLANTRHMSII